MKSYKKNGITVTNLTQEESDNLQPDGAAIMVEIVEQLDAAHHLNRLSDKHNDVFNFVAKVKYENGAQYVTAAEVKAAAEWIDNEMLTRHLAGKATGGRPREDNVSEAALRRRESRARGKK